MLPRCVPAPASTTGATRHGLLACAAATLALFAAGLLIYVPFWEANDDVGMSMLAHGYGIAKTPTPLLLFSNVVIGYLLQVLPTIDGVLPYSWLHMALMLVSGWTFLYMVVRAGGPFWLAVVALAIVFARFVAAPQFTITAGLTSAAGILACISHVKSPSPKVLAAGALLVVTGFLIRWEECLFIGLIALPLVPWSKISVGRTEIVTAGLALGFLAFAILFDRRHYATEDWAAFNAMEYFRTELTDFSFAEQILKHSEDMHAHGFTANDIRLISRWFYVDPAVADPERLKALFAAVPHTTRFADNLYLGWTAISSLAHPAMAPLLIAAIVLSALSRCTIRLIASWVIFLTVIAAFGFVGRAGVLHTYYPVPVLLMFAALACGLKSIVREPMFRVVPWTVALAALALMLNVNIVENSAMQRRSELAREDVAKLDWSKTHILWGASFPSELVLPVLERETERFNVPQYGLGWEALMPVSIKSYEGTPWRDLADRIARDTDIPFVVDKSSIDLLATYCRNHHKGQLHVEETPLSTFTVYSVTCRKL